MKNYFKKYSDEELIELLEDYYLLYEQGKIAEKDGNGVLRPMLDKIEEEYPDVAPVHFVEDELLFEISVRWLRQNKTNNLEDGAKIWYADEKGVEEGQIYTVGRTDMGEVESVGVYFGEDFDVFYPDALDSCLFSSERKAKEKYAKESRKQ